MTRILRNLISSAFLSRKSAQNYSKHLVKLTVNDIFDKNHRVESLDGIEIDKINPRVIRFYLILLRSQRELVKIILSIHEF